MPALKTHTCRLRVLVEIEHPAVAIVAECFEILLEGPIDLIRQLSVENSRMIDPGSRVDNLRRVEDHGSLREAQTRQHLLEVFREFLNSTNETVIDHVQHQETRL